MTFLGRRVGYFSYLLAKEEILKEYTPFPNILPYRVDLEEEMLFPKSDLNEQQIEKIKVMSLSGYQHKLKVSIDHKKIRPKEGEAIMVVSKCVELADVLEYNHHDRVQKLIENV